MENRSRGSSMLWHIARREDGGPRFLTHGCCTRRMASSSRNLTAWDVAALRVSQLNATDDMPALSRAASLKSTYGLRALPINLGSLEDLGLDPSQCKELEADDVPASTKDLPARSPHDSMDLYPISFLLRQDVLMPCSNHWTGLSNATIRLRRGRRVVHGTVERQSPYWHRMYTPHASEAGPLRASIPLTSADLDRSHAVYQRSALTSRANRRRSRTAHRSFLQAAVSKRDATVESGDLRHRLERVVKDVLPQTVLWTEGNERTWQEDRYGWIHAPEPDGRIPASTMLQSLHFYAAQFYHANDVLQPVHAIATPSDISPSACEEICNALMKEVPDSMLPGTPLWEYWARHSLGCGRSMLQRFDGSAIVALGSLVRTYTQHVLPRQAMMQRSKKQAPLADALRAERRDRTRWRVSRAEKHAHVQAFLNKFQQR